jgi:hypothetical protein
MTRPTILPAASSAVSSSPAPTLAIVIPAVCDTSLLEETLVSVLENRPADCEIIVPLGCRYDDPWNVSEEVRFVPAPTGSGIVSCTNLGLAATRAPIVHLLAAGWRATPGWTDAAVERLASGDLAAVVPVAVAADDRQRIVSAGIRVTSGGRRIDIAARKTELDVTTARPSGPCLEAGFWRADVLEALGPGFATGCGETYADADMAAALAAIGAAVALEPDARVVAGPARPRTNAFLEGLRAERVFWRSLAAGWLVPRFTAHAVEVVRHAVARAPVGTLPALFGRLLAAVQFGSTIQRARELRAVARSGALHAAEDRDAGDSAGRITVRIDGAHGEIARPQGGQEPAAPLKRSA